MKIILNDNYCVYCHTNNINGKKYIGMTKYSPEKRWGKGKYYKSCIAFHNAIIKYGWDNFFHEIVATNLTKEEAQNFERLLIEKLDTRNPLYGYNIRVGGDNHGDFSMGNNPRAKKVVCDGKEYSCIAEFAGMNNVKYSTARAWLNGNNNMPQEWIDKGLNYKDDPILHTPAKGKAHFGENNCKSKPVVCEGVEYSCIKYCALYYGIKSKTMQGWLNKNKIPTIFLKKGCLMLIQTKPQSKN